MIEVAPGIHLLTHRNANMYLLDRGDCLTLIDTGFPGSEDAVLSAITALGRRAQDLTDIVLTHAHYDHIGSAAALVTVTGARTWMHPLDAPIAQAGGGGRPASPAPGLLAHLLFRLYARPGRTTAPVAVDQLVQDGDTIPVAGGLKVIHIPGHCAGQIALLHPSTGALFVADAAMNVLGLTDPIGFEDQPLGRASQHRLAALDFATACFGHGKPVPAARFKQKWASATG